MSMSVFQRRHLQRVVPPLPVPVESLLLARCFKTKPAGDRTPLTMQLLYGPNTKTPSQVGYNDSNDSNDR